MAPRSTVHLFLACGLLLAGWACATARGASTFIGGLRVPQAPDASGEEPQIQPDRPDLTNSTYTVPKGLVQLEVGAQRERVPDSGQSVTTPVSMRAGLGHWCEVRMDSDGLTRERNAGQTSTASAGFAIGGKFRVWAPADGAPVLAVMPSVTMPWGRTGGGTDFTLRVISGGDLTERIHLDVNYVVSALAQQSSHVVEHIVSASTNVAIGERWNPYVEVYWVSSKLQPDARPTTAIDAGTSYTIGPRLALDGGMAFGLRNAVNGPAVFGGLSVILGEVGGHRGVQARMRDAQLRGDR